MAFEVQLAEKVQSQIHQLAAISDQPSSLCRTFLSPAMKQANALVGGWMTDLGCQVGEDGWGNLIGRLPANSPDAPILLIGSHLDTVPDAGKFDGPLGVLVALASVESLHDRGIRLPFHLDILAFSDEEGTRFHTAYLGSKALAGVLDDTDLDRTDADGKSVREAVATYQGVRQITLPATRYQAEQLLGYVEVHIEQGPILEKLGQALGVVDALAAQTRLVYTLQGRAGHAGTTPMNLRRDALAGAAELILAVERRGLEEPGLVATVGQLHLKPGASNVIPDRVRLTVDLRHPSKDRVEEACRQLAEDAEALAVRRGLEIEHAIVQTSEGITCSPRLSAQLARAVADQQTDVPHLVSGAGHDGVVLSRLTEVAMLFVRCREGLSHHPDEHVELGDIAAAIRALAHFLQHFAPE